MPDKKLVNDFHTHRLDVLVGISGLKDLLEDRVRRDQRFRSNWETVGGWNEGARYNHVRTESEAREVLRAVTDPSFGVLPWLKTLY